MESAQQRNDTSDAIIERKVDIGDRYLTLIEMGQGQPTVILEGNLGSSHTSWSTLQPALAAFTHVISYNRAGQGTSHPATSPRTCQHMVDDLSALLQNAQLPGPYILVGHAFGAMNSLLYAHQHPTTTAAVVLLDPMHPDWQQRMRDTLPEPIVGEDAEITRFRHHFVTEVEDPTTNAECAHFQNCNEQIRAIDSIGDIPLVIISAAEPGLPLPYAQLWKSLQKEFLSLSPNSTLITAQESGPEIQDDQPQLVSNTISHIIRGLQQ
ncbi:MAG TPA: alpha/beta hydrolase [Dictyobacter sp.]|nr:alpha/beta hydrolase [Dictyobacter sp.]